MVEASLAGCNRGGRTIDEILAMEIGMMMNTYVVNDGTVSTGWEDRAAGVSSDLNAHPALKRALAEGLEQDPALAVKNAETVYQIMVGRALAQPSREWKWRSQPTWCWVCNSHNTSLVGEPGYGIVHQCLDCGDQFLVDGAIQWAE